MLAELSIIPLGEGVHISNELARVVKIIKGSGLSYQLTPSGTCLEGNWDEVITTIRLCHEAVRENSSHVITTIKIEDEQGENNKLVRNIASVEEKVAAV
ncbi:MAG: MTH1187 family thiamine-binding protein [Chitinivibrionales bacterium]